MYFNQQLGLVWFQMLTEQVASQREIEYLEYKISSLNNEIDAWQKAYEDYADILIEHGLL